MNIPQEYESRIPQLENGEFVPSGMPSRTKQSRTQFGCIATGCSNQGVELANVRLLQGLKRVFLPINENKRWAA